MRDGLQFIGDWHPVDTYCNGAKVSGYVQAQQLGRLIVVDSELNQVPQVSLWGRCDQAAVPSPDAPQGVSGVEPGVWQRVGRNLFDPALMTQAGFACDENGRYTADDPVEVIWENKTNAPGVFTLSVDTLGDFECRAVYRDSTAVTGRTCTQDYNRRETFTTQQGSTVQYIAIKASCLWNVQIESGNAAGGYEPYALQEISFGSSGTIYGVTDEPGCRDVIVYDHTGWQLRHRTAQITFDGSEAWANQGNGLFTVEMSGAPAGDRAVICSHFPCALGEDAAGLCAETGETLRFVLRWQFSTAYALKTFLAASPVTVCYVLANPTVEGLAVNETPVLCRGRNCMMSELDMSVSYRTAMR